MIEKQLNLRPIRKLKRFLRPLFAGTARMIGAYPAGGKNQLRIFTYHRVNDRADDHEAVSRADFERQVAYLKTHFRLIGFRELDMAVKQADSLDKVAMVTFDDGFEDNLTIAAPILRRLDVTACFFITTGYADTDKWYSWEIQDGLHNRKMTWPQIKKLLDMGFEIGAHTVTHRSIGKLTRKEACHEISESKAELERHVGADILAFAFPFGRHADISYDLRDFLEANFAFACTTIKGNNDLTQLERAFLHRTVISGTMPFSEFLGEVYGVYDFLDRIREKRVFSS